MSHQIFLQILNSGRVYGNLTAATNRILLIEKDESAKLRKVNILDLPSNTMVLALDKIKTDTLFQKGKGQNTRCDYLIITDDKVIFVEMKSHEDAPNVYRDDCIKKYTSSKCLLAYIDEVVLELYQQPKILEHKDQHYVLLYKDFSINKTSTSLKPSTALSNTTPEHFLDIAVENDGEIYFKQLSI